MIRLPFRNRFASEMSETIYVGTDTGGRWGLGTVARELIQDARDLWRGRSITYEFVRSTLQARYQNSVLGVFWTLLNPLLMLAVMSIVFSQILRFDLPRYSVFLIAGLIPWQFFSASVTAGSVSLIMHQGLIRKINVRLFHFPIADLAIAATHNVVAMIAMLVLALIMGARITEHIVLLIPGLLFLYVFTLGAALIAMTATTYFRDMEHMIGVGMQALYFSTPIFFPAEQVPALSPLMSANPMTWILIFFQDAIYWNRWPPTTAWIVAPAASLTVLVLGYALYKRKEHEFIFRL